MWDFLDKLIKTEILFIIAGSILFFVLIVSVIAKTAWNGWRHKIKSYKLFDDMGKERDED